jgi:hypothetical protein
MQQHTLAGDGQSSAARQVSTRQLREITDTITELKGQESQQVKEVKTMLNTTNMEAICYATEDIHVPAGKRLEKAATAAIAMPLDQLHCAMIFEVEGIPRIAIADSDYSGSESDDSSAPELISESESESYSSDDDSDDENSEENTLTANNSGQQRAKPTLAVLTATTEEIKHQPPTTGTDQPRSQQAKSEQTEAMSRIKQRLKQKRSIPEAVQAERSTAIPPMV